MNKHYIAVPIEKRLPEKMKFVPTIDEDGEIIIYRLTDYGWNMRDAVGENSPNNNKKIVAWLEETTELEQYKKMRHRHLVLKARLHDFKEAKLELENQQFENLEKELFMNATNSLIDDHEKYLLEFEKEVTGQSDAIEFAEWIRDEMYVRYFGSDEPNRDKWYKAYTKPDRKYYTSEELYKLFKEDYLKTIKPNQ